MLKKLLIRYLILKTNIENTVIYFIHTWANDWKYIVRPLVDMNDSTSQWRATSVRLSVRKNLSKYEIKTLHHGKCLNDFYSRVANVCIKNSLVRFLILHLFSNSWIKIVRCQLYPSAVRSPFLHCFTSTFWQLPVVHTSSTCTNAGKIKQGRGEWVRVTTDCRTSNP